MMRLPISALLFIAFMFSGTTEAKTIDLRNQTDADGTTREISLCARPSPDKPGLPGHAFVAFGEVSKDGKIKFRAIGHTVFSVAEAILSYSGLVTATGALVDEKYSSVKQKCLTLQVNKPDYDASYVQVAQPLSSIGITFDESKPIQKAYSLGGDDCVKLMISQAQRFTMKGLNVPARQANELPLPYVRRLIEAN